MALLPTIADEQPDEFGYTDQPSLTYRMKVDNEDGMDGQVIGHTDGREAVVQAVYKILNTERGEYPAIYGDQYGIEIDDLFGQPMGYVVPEAERRIKDALLQDDRIEAVDGFKFDIPRRGVLHVAFTVHSTAGDIETDKDLEVA